MERYININNNTIYWSLLILAILLGISMRIYFVVFHFTHCDDIGLAITVLRDNHLLAKFISFKEWTYAPLQYFIDVPLILLGDSYQSIIVLGRMPSFIVGLLNIVICHYFLSLFFEKKVLVLFGDVLMALSWENIIYGSQMEPYVIVVFFIFTHFCLLYMWTKENIELKRRCWISLVVCLLSCYAHYQLFMFVFAFYASLFINSIICKNYRNAKYVFVLSLINLVLCIPLFYILLRYNLLGRGLNWNAGIDNVFICGISITDGIGNCILGLIYFLSRNAFLIIKYFFTSDIFLCSNVVAIFILLSSLYGMYAINRVRKVKSSFIVYYVDCIILLYIGLVLKGSLAFGPSRHNLVLFPIILFLSIYGLYAFYNRDVMKKIVSYSVILLLSMIIISFCYVMRDEVRQRRNLISEKKLSDLSKQYDSDAIIGLGGVQYDLQLIRINGFAQNSMWLQYGLLLKDELKDRSDNIMIISNTPFRESNFNDLKSTVLIKNNRDVYDFDFDWSRLNLIYSEEKTTDREIEYASRFFENQKNGLCLYVYHIER